MLQRITLLAFTICLTSCGSESSNSDKSPPIDNEVPTPSIGFPSDESPDLIAATSFAFATITSDNSVVAWGHSDWGGDIPAQKKALLTNVKSINSTDDAFAALNSDGSVVAWGSVDSGGDTTDVELELYNIQYLMSTRHSFAALRGDGVVISWGDTYKESGSAPLITNVEHLIASGNTFSAVQTDGTVIFWGAGFFPNTYDVYPQLLAPSFSQIISSDSDGYAAILSTGSVVTWGSAPATQGFADIESQLSNVKELYGAFWGFVASLSDGSTYYWGVTGSSFKAMPNDTTEIKNVVNSDTEVIALKGDGTLSTWGAYSEASWNDPCSGTLILVT